MIKPKIFLTLVALLTFISSGWSQTLEEEKEKLRYLKEIEWPKAYQEQDTLLLDRILASEFQMIDDSGNTFSKNDELDYIKKHAPTYDYFRFEIERLEVFENLTAIVSGKGIINGKDDTGKYLTTYHSSNVLIKRGDRWKAISSHVSGVKKEYMDKN